MDAPAALLCAVQARYRAAQARRQAAFLLGVRLPAQGDARCWLAWLDDRERARVASLRDARHAHVYAVSHAVLRCAVACALGCAPREVAYAQVAGRPCLAHDRGLDFNLSHTRGMCLVGLRAGGRIGVDVEYIDTRHPLLARAPRLCAPDEPAITPAPQRAVAHAGSVFSLWTRKEALLKSDGRALAQHRPRDLCLARGPDGAWRDARRDAVVYDMGISAGHRAAVGLMPPAAAPMLWRMQAM
ncbi:4'-phosphopantetheinyl transferase family protein [Bordetella genomosp. 13]|uniref:4'-phosphopantetheinyl transferase family protein n=1 Tax=Bordetella genomosp. 13 TaxID=463040 RepID=UPI00119EA287|nr:4'-phosphopantetheinyl transferase superfamily protein [Bordetella genomosp. 13]